MDPLPGLRSALYECISLQLLRQFKFSSCHYRHVVCPGSGSLVILMYNALCVSIFQIFCVVAAVFGVIMYRIIVVGLLYAASEEVIRKNAKLTTTATAACLNLIVILLLNRVSVLHN